MRRREGGNERGVSPAEAALQKHVMTPAHAGDAMPGYVCARVRMHACVNVRGVRVTVLQRDALLEGHAGPVFGAADFDAGDPRTHYQTHAQHTRAQHMQISTRTSCRCGAPPPSARATRRARASLITAGGGMRSRAPSRRRSPDSTPSLLASCRPRARVFSRVSLVAGAGRWGCVGCLCRRVYL